MFRMAAQEWHRKAAGQKANQVIAALVKAIKDAEELVKYHNAQDVAGSLSGSPDTTKLYNGSDSQSEADYTNQIQWLDTLLYQAKYLTKTGDTTKTYLNATPLTASQMLDEFNLISNQL